MITRPLDLASKLRPEPRSFSAFFFVNAGLIALFFSLFASQFVLTPALGVDFRLPKMAGAHLSGLPATHYLSVGNSGSFFVTGGALTMEQLRGWLVAQAKTVKAPAKPVLRVKAEDAVPLHILAQVGEAAERAGFESVSFAVEPAPEAGRGGRR